MNVWRGSQRCRLVLSWVVAAVVISGASGAEVQTAVAQTGQAAVSPTNFQSGQVTSGKSGTTLQINNANYTLKPQVIIKDDEGRERDERELQPGVQVRYHLKGGQIDQIVIVLPK